MEILADMGIFASVVEQQGFSAAARTLGMSKSNVSRRISLLEEQLGIRLLQRTTRKLGLTDGGRVYYEYCARVIAEAKQANAAINHLQSAPRGQLSVSLPETFGRAFVLPLMSEFLERYPEIRLKLSFTNRKVDLIEENFDVAIRKGELEDESLIAMPMGSSQQHLYASPGFIQKHGLPVTPNQLAEFEFLAATDITGFVPVNLFRSGRVETVRLNPRFRVKDHDAIHKMALEGTGIALVAGFLCNEDLSKGRLVRILPEWSGPSVLFNAVYPSYKGVAPNTRAFLDFIKEKLIRERPWANTVQDEADDQLTVARLVSG